MSGTTKEKNISQDTDISGRTISLRQRIGLLGGIPIFICARWLISFDATLSAGSKHVMAVTLLMAWWWITEAIPIPATALIPLAAFPLMGVQDVREVASAYGDSNIFLFMGGFFLAVTMQKWGLHRRIALHIIRIIGSSPRRIILGFMTATAALSMWISNTATTMMMYPIGLAIVLHVADLEEEERLKESLITFKTALMLGIAYAASIGGIGTLIGTPPNIVFTSQLAQIFPEAPEIGFFQWMKVGVPLVILFLPLVWLFITRVALPVKGDLPMGRDLIQEEIKKLGCTSRGEKLTLLMFTVTALAWIFRQDIEFGVFTLPGWSRLLNQSSYINDSTVAILSAVLLFIIPVNLKRGQFLLDWESARRIPWGILILFGGGIALAKGCEATGLANWIGMKLELFAHVPTLLMILMVCLMLTFLTEVTSNTAITTIFMPILAATAVVAELHPFLLMVPATISASCAFMLPVATPPNAIVFGSGNVTIPQMAKTGLFINLLGSILITLLVYLIAIPVFGIARDVLPPWTH